MCEHVDALKKSGDAFIELCLLCIDYCVCVCVCVCVLLQIHSGGHADALQHQIQLQEEGGGDDCCGVVSLFCHLLPFTVWTQQHR